MHHPTQVACLWCVTKLVKPPCIPLRRKTWKSKEANNREQLTLNVNLKCHYIPADVENVWEDIKSGLPNTIDKTCGWAKGNHQRNKETWWWIEVVNIEVVTDAVNEKRKAWKLLKNWGSKEEYLKTTLYHKNISLYSKTWSWTVCQNQ